MQVAAVKEKLRVPSNVVLRLAKALKKLPSNILGGTLVTIQTGEAGKKVNKVLIAQDVYYPGPNPIKEFYLSILLDRSKGQECNYVQYPRRNGY